MMFVIHGFVMTHCNGRTLQEVMNKASEIVLGDFLKVFVILKSQHANVRLPDVKKECLFYLDIDECSRNSSACDSENGGCLNSVGSYNCLCNSGYELSNDGITCNGKDVTSN